MQCFVLLSCIACAVASQSHPSGLVQLEDKTIRAQATCRVGGQKIPCAVPHLIHGAGPLYANVTGPLVDVGSGCKSMKQSGSGQIALVVKSGRCSFHKMAQKALFADFEGLVVIESAKFKGKKKAGEKELGLPVVVVQEKEFKKMKKLLPDASSASSTVSIVSMKQTPDGMWKTSTQVYWEAVKLFDNKMYNQAVEFFQYSVGLEPRAHVAWHALSNTLLEMNRTEEAHAIVSNIMDMPDGPIRSYKVDECTERNHELMQPKGGKENEGRLRVVTVATHEKPQLATLRESVFRSGHTLEVIGMGTTYPGLGLKLMAMTEWLPSVPDEDYILLVDGYDVLFLMPSHDILERYKKFCTPVLFSAETRCHPDTALALLHPGGAQFQQSPEDFWQLPFHYLNSGSYIGRADFVKEMFAKVHADLEAHYSWNGADYRQVNDQRWMMRYWMQHQHTGLVALDVHGELFHTLHQVDPGNFSVSAEGTLFSEFTKTSPALLHGNGADGKAMIKHFSQLFEEAGWLTPGGMRPGGESEAKR